jgi:hypothetical protein
VCLLHWSLWLRSRVHLRGWVCLRHGTLLLGGRMHLRSWTFLRSRPYRLNWPLLGFRSCRRCLRDRPFRLNRLVGGPGQWPLLHHWGRSRLTPFHGKRPGGYDRLRLAAVYGNKLGAIRARCNPLLLLNG